MMTREQREEYKMLQRLIKEDERNKKEEIKHDKHTDFLETYEPKGKLSYGDTFLKVTLPVLTVFAILFIGIFSFSTIDGSSMEPTLHDGEAVFVQKHFFSIGKDNIIVAQQEYENGYINIIKRVVATEGDTITSDGEYIYVNGSGVSYAGGDQTYPIVVPEGSYFCVGDNNDYSTDSRFTSVGFITEDQVKGKLVSSIFRSEVKKHEIKYSFW